MLDRRNKKMTRTILMLLAMTIISNLALITLDLLTRILPEDLIGKIESPTLYHITNAIYASQFGLNFVIYALKNDQFRKAYKELGKYLISRLINPLKVSKHK